MVIRLGERKDRGAIATAKLVRQERQPMDGAPDACAAVDSAQENCK